MEKSEKFWDRSASRYDKEEMKDRNVRMKILEKIEKFLAKQDAVLDYGCATGIIAGEIASSVNSVLGIDISSNMIQIAQRKSSEHKIRNVRYLQATIFDAGLTAGSFDLVLGIYLLHLLDDMPRVLSRVHELLKPGGVFISVTPCLSKYSFTGIALSFANKIGLIPHLNLLKFAELETEINKADFKIIETECIKTSGQQQFIASRK
ncbi:class I SAM-dependent methyltransferase [Olivibacter domesticus]|uniref:Ubiquinone/menaquinone biosynthesis C-methylase UbiE n=1 Tax=Olivibacter domesticus TaxID=407022 RepID=A0A1H7II31_OLID1|nr:class I SAM-dependent methyltransferase [Olivibacter domesticus]SEK62058.1 Ubiquinone/menaquinone biosynthesis C-methylase UbiE [Olivibacter domesticus]